MFGFPLHGNSSLRHLAADPVCKTESVISEHIYETWYLFERHFSELALSTICCSHATYIVGWCIGSVMDSEISCTCCCWNGTASKNNGTLISFLWARALWCKVYPTTIKHFCLHFRVLIQSPLCFPCPFRLYPARNAIFDFSFLVSLFLFLWQLSFPETIVCVNTQANATWSEEKV